MLVGMERRKQRVPRSNVFYSLSKRRVDSSGINVDVPKKLRKVVRAAASSHGTSAAAGYDGDYVDGGGDDGYVDTGVDVRHTIGDESLDGNESHGEHTEVGVSPSAAPALPVVAPPRARIQPNTLRASDVAGGSSNSSAQAHHRERDGPFVGGERAGAAISRHGHARTVVPLFGGHPVGANVRTLPPPAVPIVPAVIEPRCASTVSSGEHNSSVSSSTSSLSNSSDESGNSDNDDVAPEGPIVLPQAIAAARVTENGLPTGRNKGFYTLVDGKRFKLNRVTNVSRLMECVECQRGRVRKCLADGIWQCTVLCTPDCQADPLLVDRVRVVTQSVTNYVTSNNTKAQVYAAARDEFEAMHHPGDEFLSVEAHRKRLSRTEAKTYPPVPKHYADLLTMQQMQDNPTARRFTQTRNGQQFLQYVGEYIHNNASTKLMIFATRRDLINLVEATNIKADGTFTVVPKPFAAKGQLFIIHSFRGGVDPNRQKLIPRVYMLLSGKSAPLYNFAFDRLVEVIQRETGKNPTQYGWLQFGIDYETGLEKALREYFLPMVAHLVRMEGCEFHEAQCDFRDLANRGLTAVYRDESTNLSKLFQLNLAVHHLPIDRVQAAFQTVRTVDALQLLGPALYNDYRIQGHLNYLQTNWIDDDTRRAMANVYEREDRRTSNDVEGLHSGIRAELSPHSHLWKFIEGLQKVQQRYHRIEADNDAGRSFKLRKKKWRKKEERLKNLKEQYQTPGNPIYNHDGRYIKALQAAMIKA